MIYSKYLVFVSWFNYVDFILLLALFIQIVQFSVQCLSMLPHIRHDMVQNYLQRTLAQIILIPSHTIIYPYPRTMTWKAHLPRFAKLLETLVEFDVDQCRSPAISRSQGATGKGSTGKSVLRIFIQWRGGKRRTFGFLQWHYSWDEPQTAIELESLRIVVSTVSKDGVFKQGTPCFRFIINVFFLLENFGGICTPFSDVPNPRWKHAFVIVWSSKNNPKDLQNDSLRLHQWPLSSRSGRVRRHGLPPGVGVPTCWGQ